MTRDVGPAGCVHRCCHVSDDRYRQTMRPWRPPAPNADSPAGGRHLPLRTSYSTCSMKSSKERFMPFSGRAMGGPSRDAVNRMWNE